MDRLSILKLPSALFKLIALFVVDTLPVIRMTCRCFRDLVDYKRVKCHIINCGEYDIIVKNTFDSFIFPILTMNTNERNKFFQNQLSSIRKSIGTRVWIRAFEEKEEIRLSQRRRTIEDEYGEREPFILDTIWKPP